MTTKKIDELIEEIFQSDADESEEVEMLEEESDIFSKFLGGRDGILRNEAKLNSTVLRESMEKPELGEHPARVHDKRYRESVVNSTYWRKA